MGAGLQSPGPDSQLPLAVEVMNGEGSASAHMDRTQALSSQYSVMVGLHKTSKNVKRFKKESIKGGVWTEAGKKKVPEGFELIM